MSPFRDDDVKFRAPTHKHHCWNNVLWPPQKFSKILWILIRYYHSSHQFDTYKVNKIRIKADFLFTSRHVTSRHMPLTYIVTYVRQRPQKRPNNSCIDTVKLWRDWKKRQRHRIYRYSALTDTNHYSLTYVFTYCNRGRGTPKRPRAWIAHCFHKTSLTW